MSEEHEPIEQIEQAEALEPTESLEPTELIELDEQNELAEHNEPGRPPVLDDRKKGEICAVLATGGTRATAAAYVGCHPDTIRNTELRDEEFAMQLEMAESKHEVTQLALISVAGKESRHWRAAAWALERRYPTRYGRRRPELFTLDQVSHVVTQFAGVILDEVTDQQQRENILTRLTVLSASLRSTALAGEDS